jgi:hypothetical protein
VGVEPLQPIQDRKDGRKDFFFEKKKQKTFFIYCVVLIRLGAK